MPRVAIENGAIHVGTQRLSLFAGEMHYWRLSPMHWHSIVQRVRDLGLNVIATYIPWQFHELEPGRFDFAGETDPQRNLLGFLDLLREENFWVFIRPGPYIYAEWTNMGVPDRVVHLPRISEAYRREARTWMEAVTAALRPHFATQSDDGRIILLQADNEIDLFSHWFEKACGLADAPGPFHEFLRSAYASVAALNDAWGTNHRAFEDAQAFASPADAADAHQRNRARDYWRFQHWATREILRWHVETYRALGVDVPILANYYPGGDVQNWRELRSVADALGIDWYPRNEFGRDANEHRRFLDSCRHQRIVSPLPCIAEFECGIWHGWHDHVGAPTPHHYRLMAFSALAAGIGGWNWYMLVGRDNWYFSPINERGEMRPELAGVFMRLQQIVREIDPPSLRKLTSTCAVLDAEQIATDRLLERNEVLRALYEADADFEVFDAAIGETARPVMFYAAAGWLPEPSQQRLLREVERGATLVFFQQAPLRDEQQRDCNVPGLRPPDRVLSHLGKQVEIELAPGVAGESSGSVWVWDELPGGAAPLVGTQIAGWRQAVETSDVWARNAIGRTSVCGYVERRGSGRIVMIGVPPTASLVRAVHRWSVAPLYAQARTPHIATSLFERASDHHRREHILLAASMNASALQTIVQLEGLPGEGAVVNDLWTGETCPCVPGGIVISLDAFSGGAWRIAGPPATS